MMRNHVITVIGRTIEHVIYPLDSKPAFDSPQPPIKIIYRNQDKNKTIQACLETLKKELEGEL